MPGAPARQILVCRTRLSAKRFIAGVGGSVPGPLATAGLSNKAGPPAAPPSLSLPMMRSATLHTASIADHLLLADHHIVEQAFKLRGHPRIDQGRAGLFENAE
jgi:hypothetical protein